jgi:hypothetical protein
MGIEFRENDSWNFRNGMQLGMARGIFVLIIDLFNVFKIPRDYTSHFLTRKFLPIFFVSVLIICHL